MSARSMLLQTLSLVLLGALCAGQSPAPQSRAVIILSKLRGLLEPVGVYVDSESVTPKITKARAIHLKWEKPLSARGEGGARRLAIISQSARGRLQPQRSFELAMGTLLVAAVDASGKLHAWRTIPDPRFLRSEAPGPDGVLTGVTVENPSPVFRVFVPDDPEVVDLRFYAPQQRADGTLSLVLVDKVRVP